ncbi:FtsX-like permease family protein [Oceanidesulfovibrio marinus]|uniref:ABC3 transporter permease C-terminal domain-containing protein n=1 Tax=Oceanidesulfovibrio marinus TaxID=370038 RepID=A0A6P1ZHT6_9BACT|nr:FtsX-like permease family protein [Oceanidesulfovibrio marinus]TVM34584.1 hypothetical protein DQK91_08410 [Oceanidesulfovibrio marinus]
MIATRCSRLGAAVFLVLACLLQAAPAAALDTRQVIEELSSYGDRSVGSVGSEKAAEYVADTFERLVPEATFKGLGEEGEGRLVDSQPFRMPVRKHGSSEIVLQGSGKRADLHPLVMNAIAPGTLPAGEPPRHIVYVGPGELEDFDGAAIKDAVVLMDLDSGKNWMNAALLGARALIYLDDPNITESAPRWFFEDKLELTPIDFPRFWMPKQDAMALFGPLEKKGDLGITATLTNDIAWTDATAENVYCFIPGSDKKLAEQLVIFEAFYDSTAYVPSASPGADEAVSIARLLDLAEHFGKNPPKRNVLLLATAGHSQAQAGMREFIMALELRGRYARTYQQDLRERASKASAAVKALKRGDPLAADDDEAEQAAREAINQIIKTRVDKISTRLMRLRLQEKESLDPKLVDSLAKQRSNLRQLGWLGTYKNIDPESRERLLEILPEALAEQQAVSRDANRQIRMQRASSKVRSRFGGMEVVASVSLHLSSHGDGVGSFDQGWLYDLRSDVNNSRSYSDIDDYLMAANEELLEDGGPDLYRDTLRPSRLRTWQSYLPDQPDLAGEVATMAGMLGLTVATLHDARPDWGTPYDTIDHVDFDYLGKQGVVIRHMATALADGDVPTGAPLPRKGIAMLTGRANLLRQGELFPDLPARGTVVLCYQGSSRYYAMVDTMGYFVIPGLADRKHTNHKAILEPYRFNDDGRVQWAVDKAQTGLDAYRVKMVRSFMETDLVLFTCAQTNLFNTLEPRTFKFMTRIDLYDARTEAEPLRYWYSRLDTWSSTINAIFVDPGVPFKATLSDTVLGRKMILLNSTPEDPNGKGFLPGEWPIIPYTAYQAAKDMWNLVTPRLENLEDKGIVNNRLRALMDEGRADLERADKALADKKWDVFMEKSRSSWAMATRVYNDVDKTQKDVLVGVLFYVALFAPFAYCMERLLFGYANIHKRIVAFLGILVAIIGIIYAIHPAFQLTYSPLVVIIAFFIVGLSFLVSCIIFFRFEREMTELQRRSRHLKTSEISKFGAFMAAFVLGVSNLRRRPIRTALTTATLIILTFTIMNFTAVKSVRQHSRTMFSNTAAYEGLLMKRVGWKDLAQESLNAARDMFHTKGLVAPRVWYVTPQDISRPHQVPVHKDNKSFSARGLVGLSAVEPQVSGLDATLTRGRWLKEDERNAVVIPERMAQILGVDLATPEGRRVQIWGMDYEVVGCFDSAEYEKHVDLDGEPITPVVYPSETFQDVAQVEADSFESGEDLVSFQGRYEHIPAEQVVIMYHTALLAITKGGGGLGGGGRLKAIALKPYNDNNLTSLGQWLSDRFGLMLFVGDKNGTALYFAADQISYSGVPNIIIPLIISVLIVLNTMIGSVYERKGEIAVYTSVGLAPSHVSFLFVAESLAFAVISVVLGYLVAQTAAEFLAGTPIWAGMTANYSSMAGVAAMILVMAVVLISVIYPSKVAANIAIPDVNRSWTMPDPKGNELTVTLPFLVKTSELGTAGGFLLNYYEAHKDISHGLFSSADMNYQFTSSEDLPAFARAMAKDDDVCFTLTMRTWLAPFDFGVRQRVTLVFCPADEYPGFRQIKVRLFREAGEHSVWRNLSKSFLNALRKQLLVWRSLEETARMSYEEELRHKLEETHGWQPERGFSGEDS